MEIKTLKQVLEDCESILTKKHNGESIGYKTKWKKFNTLLGGELQFEQTIILGGRTGVGKSAISNILITDILENNKDINCLMLYWNFEMSNFRQGLRLLSRKTNTSVNSLLSEKSNLQKVKDAIINYNEFNTKMWFIECSVTSKQIKDKISQTVEKYPEVKIFNVIDHCRLIKKENKEAEIEMLFNLMYELNEMKKEYVLNNLLISQLNRDAEKSMLGQGENIFPQISHLFGSDAIGQFADLVLLPFRPEKYNIQTINLGNEIVETIGKIFINIPKNRDGETGVLIFNEDLANNNITEFNNEI